MRPAGQNYMICLVPPLVSDSGREYCMCDGGKTRTKTILHLQPLGTFVIMHDQIIY